MSHCFTAVFEPCLINGKTELLRHNTRTVVQAARESLL